MKTCVLKISDEMLKSALELAENNLLLCGDRGSPCSAEMLERIYQNSDTYNRRMHLLMLAIFALRKLDYTQIECRELIKILLDEKE